MKEGKTIKTIGILGGMGPAASADLYTNINEKAQLDYHAEQDTDYPPLFIYSMPLEGFDETGFVDPDSVKKQLIEGVKKLESIGSDFIVIACNTVHHFYEEMQSAVSIPILNILDVTSTAVKHHGYNTIGLLSSASTREYGIYESAFEKNSIKTISVTDVEQEHLDKVILHIMSGSTTEDDLSQIKIICSRLIDEGSQAIVLGCTELPLAISQSDLNIPIFGSTALLSDAALKKAYE